MRRLPVLLSLVATAVASRAHDTWFEPLPARGEVALALGTGNRFPVFDLAVDTKYFVKSGCRGGDGRSRALEWQRYTDKTTLLRVRANGTPVSTCWIQLEPFEFELPQDKIEIYFREIRPSAAVLAAWAGLRARGLPFLERYTKNARIDLGSTTASQPTGTAMDVLREAPAGALAVGAEATLRVLREGKPLADFPVELVNERNPVGLWHRTDAEGRIRAKMPSPGRWILRGTDLRLSASDPTRWESQFITYAFEVAR
ncbi:MAG: DUF4198 domain-containing protein [Aquincola sp.]|nr:DUF4198 domain-containing protein [Aquincola sp.]MDH4287895.1 DUF4198 domain-containing protein [Aquincola sp.]MDH5328326.1 DUF4198 domain-containing protein [Aquincola sp.]